MKTLDINVQLDGEIVEVLTTNRLREIQENIQELIKELIQYNNEIENIITLRNQK